MRTDLAAFLLANIVKERLRYYCSRIGSVKECDYPY